MCEEKKLLQRPQFFTIVPVENINQPADSSRCPTNVVPNNKKFQHGNCKSEQKTNRCSRHLLPNQSANSAGDSNLDGIPNNEEPLQQRAYREPLLPLGPIIAPVQPANQNPRVHRKHKKRYQQSTSKALKHVRTSTAQTSHSENTLNHSKILQCKHVTPVCDREKNQPQINDKTKAKSKFKLQMCHDSSDNKKTLNGQLTAVPQAQTIVFKPKINIPSSTNFPQSPHIHPIPPPPQDKPPVCISCGVPPPPPRSLQSPTIGSNQQPPNITQQILPASTQQPQPLVVHPPAINVHQHVVPTLDSCNAKCVTTAVPQIPTKEPKLDLQRTPPSRRLPSSSSNEALIRRKRKQKHREQMKPKSKHYQSTHPPSSSAASSDDVHKAIWREINHLGKSLNRTSVTAADNGNPNPPFSITNQPAVINIRNGPPGSQNGITIKEERRERRLEQKLQEIMRDELRWLTESKTNTDKDPLTQSKPNVHFSVPLNQDNTKVKPILKRQTGTSMLSCLSLICGLVSSLALCNRHSLRF